MSNNSSFNHFIDGEFDKRIVTGEIIVGMIYVFLICFGLVFNSVVIHTFRKTRSFQTPTNLFIVGLAYNDMFMVVVGMPFVTVSCFNGKWIFGPVLCVSFGFVNTVGGITSIGILTAISIDRYFVVTKTHLAKTITVYRAKVALLGCLVYSCVWAILPLFGWGGYTEDISEVHCGPDWHTGSPSIVSYNIALLSLVFIIPTSVIIACYIQIIIKIFATMLANTLRINHILHGIFLVSKVRGHRFRIADPRVTYNQAAQRRELNVTIAVLFAIVAFIFAWSPYAIVSLWTMMYGPLAVSKTTALLPALLAKSASAWNPIVYVARNKAFRKAFIVIMTNSSNDIVRNGGIGTSSAMQQSSTSAHASVHTLTTRHMPVIHVVAKRS